MARQSPLKKSIMEGGPCVGQVKHLLIGDMFRPWDVQHSSVAPSLNYVYHVLY